jgi:hypothetical protein
MSSFVVNIAGPPLTPQLRTAKNVSTRSSLDGEEDEDEFSDVAIAILCWCRRTVQTRRETEDTTTLLKHCVKYTREDQQ